MFLKISQTPQENTCVGVFYYEVASLQPASFLKRDSNTSAFLWSLRNYFEHLFWRTSANDCLWRCSIKKLFLKTLLYLQDKHVNILWLLKTLVLESLFNPEYCEIFKSTYFEEHLQTAATENVFIKIINKEI